MPKTKKPKQPKEERRGRGKPVSLWPLSFQEALAALLKTRPIVGRGEKKASKE